MTSKINSKINSSWLFLPCNDEEFRTLKSPKLARLFMVAWDQILQYVALHTLKDA